MALKSGMDLPELRPEYSGFITHGSDPGGGQKKGAREPARWVENKKPQPGGLGTENLARVWRFQGATDGPSIESSLLDTPEMRKLRVSPAPLL